VSRKFMQELDKYLGEIPIATESLPPADAAAREAAYNGAAVEAAPADRLLMDKRLVRAEDRPDPVELCDILTRARRLIHVKRHLGSSDLSHLFAQGAVSAELIQGDPNFRKAAQRIVDKVAGNRKFRFFPAKGIDASKFEIVYAIVADWRGRSLATALPFFSKVNLRATRQRIVGRGYRVSCLPISYR
jgi:uncharacterized protein (TIGR04141 family)